jgi:nucleotide-binding universal stress UspA family protein
MKIVSFSYIHSSCEGIIQTTILMSSNPDLLPPLKIMLVCVDGSEVGFRAADFAMSIAAGVHPKLIFLNIVGASASEREYEITADMVGSFQLLGKEALSKCDQKARGLGLECETIQRSGDPVDEILRLATATKPDCIVMGHRSLSRSERLVVDNVSEDVLRRCEVPVIIVK